MIYAKIVIKIQKKLAIIILVKFSSQEEEYKNKIIVNNSESKINKDKNSDNFNKKRI